MSPLSPKDGYEGWIESGKRGLASSREGKLLLFKIETGEGWGKEKMDFLLAPTRIAPLPFL